MSFWRVNPDDLFEIESDDEGRCSIAYVETDNCEPSTAAAEARLIAAAPEMLVALEEALPALELGQYFDGEVLEVAAGVREAIAKAKGYATVAEWLATIDKIASAGRTEEAK